jgi:CubicO group peptidase (beta-lactamase class C family)
MPSRQDVARRSLPCVTVNPHADPHAKINCDGAARDSCGDRRRRMKWRIGLAFAVIGGISIWWTILAGPVTVSRTVIHNFSDIDDHQIFPQRKLLASAKPFQFREAAAAAQARWPATRIGPHDATLGELLRATDTTAFLVVKDGAIAFESYAGGYGRTTPSLSFSVAKSIFSILVACALEDGYFRSLDQPVTDFIPELRSRGFEAVTIRHLMQMTSGVDYAENGFPLGIHARYYYTDRLESEILKLALEDKPGTRFRYKSGDAYLLALALRTLAEYMQHRLWRPLGMESDGFWSIDHEPGGLEKVGCCLAATARDVAKFGQLFLNKGIWDERRIVSAEWTERATKADSSVGSSWGYQYMWWRIAPDRSDFIATGHLGQFLYVNPVAKVVVVRLGKGLGRLSVKEWKDLFVSLSEGTA